MGVGGQKHQKVEPETANLHRDIVSNHRFCTVTHLGQIVSFTTFWSTVVVKKGQKLPMSVKATP